MLRFIKSCKDLQELIEYVSANATIDCEQVVACVNDQLALANAGTLTNFNTRVVQALVDYFNQTGVQAPTAAEVCSYLNSLAVGTIDSSTKLVLGDCTYGTMADLLAYIQANISDSIVDNGDGTFTHTAVDGTTVTFDVKISTVTDNLDGTATISDDFGNSVNVLLNSDSLVDNGDGTITHTASDGTAVTFDILSLLNTALATSPNPSLSNLCSYINDCIDAGLLAVSADLNNLITTGTDGGAFLDEATVQAIIDASTDVVTNTISGHLIATHTSVDGTAVAINETVTSLGTPTLTGTVLSTPYTDETGTTTNSNIDLAPLMSSAVFQSNDDQVLTAGASSDMDVQLVPTTVADPDSQVNKTNYEISVTPKATVICSGNVLSPTNKLLTSDIRTTLAVAPVTVLATPDETVATNKFVKALAVSVGCKEEYYVPTGMLEFVQGLSIGTIDGVNTIFTTPDAVFTVNSLQVFVNGRYQIPTIDYTLSGNTITFVVAPQTGDRVSHYYAK